ncbi:MAG: hypothetical protein ACJ8FY_11705 [Gemmataceae bacterium]
MRPVICRMKLLVLVPVLGALMPASPASAADEKGEWGAIKGQIVWGDKEIPKLEAINVDKDEDHCAKKGQLFKEDFVVNKENKGVCYVFVWLTPPSVAGGKEPAPLPIHPSLKEIKYKEVIMDQPFCQFVPHALALRKGQELVVKNSAPINHNVNYQGGANNPGNNVILPAGKSVNVKDLKPSKTPISVTCNIHGWMKAWIRVFDHPYFAITDADGKFEIKNAPAGDFQLVIWHDGVGWVKGGKNGLPVQVKGNGETDLGKIEMQPPKD